MTLLLMGCGGATDGGGSPPATIGDMVYAGQTSGAATTKVITLGADIPAGALLKPAIVTRSGATSVTVTDSKGNSYSATTLRNGGSGGRLWVCEALNTNALVSGDTITFTTDSATYAVARLDYITDTVGSSFLDENIGPYTSTSATGSFSQAGPTYAQANQVAIEYLWAWDALATVTPTSGFTALTPAVNTADDYRIHTHWKKLSDTTAITHTPSWTAGASSQNVALACQSVKGAV